MTPKSKNKKEPRVLTRSEKNEIIQKRKEVEKAIEALLKKIKSNFTLNDVEKVIYNEKEAGEFQDLIMMFDDGDPDNLSNILELITNAWNYFPHKSLDNKCPQEKLLEYQI